MSWEKLIDNDLEKSPRSETDLGFITYPQYTALRHYFSGVLESMEDDENLQRYRIEFSKLLKIFQSCYTENERKTRKIFELRALGEIQVPKVKSVDSMQQLTVKNLREAISNLQKNLDKTNEERMELLEEIQVFKTTIDTQNKLIQVHTESLEDLKGDKAESFSGMTSTSTPKYGSAAEVDSTKAILKKNLKEDEGITDITVLRNNLEILVTGLKVTRKKVQELKKDISVKDTVVKSVREDLSATEDKLIQAETRISEIKKPVEAELASTKAELEEKSRVLKDTAKQLEKALIVNMKLEKDISSKESLIEELKCKVKELESAKESAFRKADVFENQLAKNHRYVETLKRELESLNGEILGLQRQIPTDVVMPKMISQSDPEAMNVNALERTIDTLKSHLVARDNKLRQVGEELKHTVEILQDHRKSYSSLHKEKISLEAEKQVMKKVLKEKNDEIKRLREQLKEVKKEMAHLERELQHEAKKRQQGVDKKNKFHSMYNHLKVMNSQQKNENMILGKRQEYLVKILKEKDKEIERIVTWKRFVC